MGVEEEYMFESIDKSFEEIEEQNEIIRKKIKEIDDRDQHCTLIIYCSGYLTPVADLQALVCNNSNPHETLFTIELKAQTLTEDYQNLDVVAMYNCTRSKLESFDLAKAR